jgi:murein L,D-transpeptidase YcbB/YkuD
MATIGMIGPQPADPQSQPASITSPTNIRLRINIPATTLEVFRNGDYVRSYPVSVGALAYKSPVMHNQLTQLVWNPSWIPPPDSSWAVGLKPEPPGPHNPLGPVKMPLDQGIRIHGTNKDSSVGRAASHGCFRMHNNDAADLAWFIQIHMSDKFDETYRTTYAKNRYRTHVVNLSSPVDVDIVYEPIEITGKILVVHPDIYGWNGTPKDKIIVAVSEFGIQESDIHPQFWQHLKMNARKGTLRVPLEELQTPPDDQRHLHKD